VSPEQFNVLRILRGQKGNPANLATINERRITRMSNTTRLVDKLLSKGYVDRIVCPSNRRKIEVTITDDGKNELKKMDKEIMKMEHALVKDFNRKELLQLNDLLHKF
jgi:DNA-binding MarR family transcriptional regulator